MILLLAGASALYLFFRPHSDLKTIDSLAVLPFTNGGPDPNAEYLSYGISDSLIRSLSQLSNLKVLAPGPELRQKGREFDVRKVGKEMGVRAVVRGSVTQTEDRLSITVELVDAEADTRLWGRQYDGDLSDIVSAQREVAKGVSENLRLEIDALDEKRMLKSYTENTEAYHLYLKGRLWRSKLSSDGYNKAIEYFNQAVEKDASYALAYAGLADCYSALIEFGSAAPKDVFPKAKEAASKALALDDGLSEAHMMAAWIALLYEKDFAATEREYKRAIELSPNSPLIRSHYAGFLMLMGRHSEAIAERMRALEIEPRSLFYNRQLGVSFYYAREYDRAIEQLRKTSEMNRAYRAAYEYLGLAYLEKGMYDQAILVTQEGIRLNPDDGSLIADLGCAYARSGETAEAQKQVERLKELAAQRYVKPMDFVRIYAELGDRDQAFARLEEAFQEKGLSVAFVRVDPQLDSLRADPRFAGLMRKFGLLQ